MDTLDKLQKILDVADREFLKANDVEQVIHLFLSVVKELKGTIDNHIADTKREVSSSLEDAKYTFSNLEQQMNSILKGTEGTSLAKVKEMGEMLKKECKRMEDMMPSLDGIENRLVELEDVESDTPQVIREKLESITTEYEKLDISAIRDLRKELDELRRRISKKTGITLFGGGGSGGGRVVKSYDLSGSLNGVLKTFTLPAFYRIISVHSTSFPFTFRPTVDYTSDASAMTITFTSEIDAGSTLATGQTLTIIYSE